jgi:hypothetical protein
MSQSTTSLLKPWEVDVNPDFFGVHLLVDGRRFFIPKERLAAVISALSVYHEKPPIADWLNDPADPELGDLAISVGQRGE